MNEKTKHTNKQTNEWVNYNISQTIFPWNYYYTSRENHFYKVNIIVKSVFAHDIYITSRMFKK